MVEIRYGEHFEVSELAGQTVSPKPAISSRPSSVSRTKPRQN